MDALKGKVVSKSSPIVTESGSRLWNYGVLIGSEIGFCWSNVDFMIDEEVAFIIGTRTKDHSFTVRIVSIG